MKPFKSKVFEKSENQPTWSSLWNRNMLIGIACCFIFFLFTPNKSEPAWVQAIKFTPLAIGLFIMKFADWPYWQRRELLKGNFIGDFEVSEDTIELLDKRFKYSDIKSISFEIDKHKGQRIENLGVYKESKGLMNKVVIKAKDSKTYVNRFSLDSVSHSDNLYSWYQKLKKEYPDLDIKWFKKKVEEKESSLGFVEVVLILILVIILISYFSWEYINF